MQHHPLVSTSVWGAGNDDRSHGTGAGRAAIRSRSNADGESRTAGGREGAGHMTTPGDPGCILGCCHGVGLGLGSVAVAEVGVRSSRSTVVCFGVGPPRNVPGGHLDIGARGVEAARDVEVVGS